MKNNLEKVSYCVGFQAGENIKHLLQGTDAALLTKGFNDSIGNRNPALDRREIEATLHALNTHIQKKHMKVVQELSAKNKQQEVSFFEKIKLKKGINSLVDGIYYEILNSGAGESPSNDCSVIIHMNIALVDGTVIENSFENATPRQFPMNKAVLPGLAKALRRMKIGDRWKLFLPSEQAFGLNGIPQRGIEPGCAIIYEVELIQILKSADKSLLN